MLDVFKFIDPSLVGNMYILLDQDVEYVLYIADQRYVRSHILAYLCCVYIYVYDCNTLFKSLRFRYRPVSKPCSDNYQYICPAHCLVGIWFAVIPEHPEIEAVLLGKDSHSHHGMYKRDIEFFTEFTDHILSFAEDDTSTRADQWLFCLIECRNHPLHLVHIDPYLRFISADLDLFRIDIILPQFAGLHIDRDVNEDRPLSSGRSNIERFPEYSRDIIRILHQIAVFDK